MKHRLEDLGRIRELLGSLSDHEVFELYEGRPKEFLDFFKTMDEEEQSDFLRKVAYGLDNLKMELSKIYIIARGDREGWELENKYNRDAENEI